MNSRFQLSLLTVLLLVVLRIAIGWHFLHEGLYKWRHASFSAEPFLRQSRGPLAPYYRKLIPDVYGLERLDMKTMFDRWQADVELAAKHYKFDEKQRAAADQQLKVFEKQLRTVIKEEDGAGDVDDKPEVAKYKEDVQKWLAESEEASVRDVPFKDERHYKQLQKLNATSAPWLKRVNQLDTEFKDELNHIATPEQVADAGRLSYPKTWFGFLEKLTTYSLIGIGACLIAGLFTRLASFGAAVFLCTAVVLPQLALPGYFPVPPPSVGHALVINKEVIEMLTLLVLATTAVGRWAGLDFFIHHAIVKPLFRGRKDK